MIWLILLIALCAFVLVYAWLVHPNMPRRSMAEFEPWDYAHRGYWTTNDPGTDNRPENSLAGFRAAVEHGYGMEMDVHLTKDGHLVVHHDDSLKRLTGADVVIGSSTLEEVRACHLPNGEPVPTFDELLDTVKGRTPLIVEVKTENGNAAALSKAVYERMKRYDGLWCMESFDPWAVEWFRRNAPEIVRGQLVNIAKAYVEYLGPLKAFVLSRLALNFLARPDFVAYNIRADHFSAPRVQRALFHTPMAAWTVTDPETFRACLERREMPIFEGFLPEKDA